MRRLKLSPAPSGVHSPRHRWEAACAGRMPAEALSTSDREDLVRLLHGQDWTDVEIADHTSMSTYTTGRIRERLELAPNTHDQKVNAA